MGEGDYDPVGPALTTKERVRGIAFACGWAGCCPSAIFVALLMRWAIICLAAGTWSWSNAWVYGIIHALGCSFFSTRLGAKYPNLWRERFSASKTMSQTATGKQTQTDKYFVWAFVFAMIATVVVAPLDGGRLVWTPSLHPFPIYVFALGIFLNLAGWLLLTAVTLENPYLFPVVKVEPGQEVISTGPYGWVRHPMYTGWILISVGYSIMLDSVWGIAVALFSFFILAWRSVHEERTLVAGLEGYSDYQKKTTSRWIPFLA